MYPALKPYRHDTTNVRCVDDNVAFVMLTEMLRARSHEMLEILRQDSANLADIRKLALNIHLSTDNLIHEAGLVAPQGQSFSPYQHHSAEPASVQGIVDLCSVAARHRLSEMKLSYEVPLTVPSDLFVSGNPWELAYALFFSLIRAGDAQNALNLQLSAGGVARANPYRSIRLQIELDADFANLKIFSHAPFTPVMTSSEIPAQPSALTASEWNCLQRLVIRNNAFIQSHPVSSAEETAVQYKLVLRVPTFPAGHEEPADIFKANAPQTAEPKDP